MKNETNQIKVRFAPSPTGLLHIGNARTAIFNWLLARHFGGLFVVRVEDTDLVRSSKEYLDAQLSSLGWLGIESDEPIVYQHSRIDDHKKQIQSLINDGQAYPCFCKPRESETVLASLGKGVGHKYDGACRSKTFSKDELLKPHAVRFKISEEVGKVQFDDLIRGKVTVDKEQLDDFVISRCDGSPVYNFCVVVDDIFMEISHVIRGEDHISNTIKQVLIYQALNASVPKFAHIPLVLGEKGNKLSKRDASVAVDEYKEKGFVAKALFNYLVRLGWSHGDQEIFTREEMIEHFDLKNVGKKGAIFDTKKLEWVNGIYIRNASCNDLMKYIEQIDSAFVDSMLAVWEKPALEKLIELYKQRSTTLIELQKNIINFAVNPKQLNLTLISKWFNDNTKKLVSDFVEKLEHESDGNHEDLLKVAKEICANYDEKLVNLAQALRLALTGTVTSPGVFELIEILGVQTSVTRINHLKEHL
jgi:glutamyl-tRNA synthetase